VDAGLNARLHRFGSAGNPDAHGLALACGMPLVPVTSDQELHRRAGALLLALGYKPASPLRGTDELDALLPVAMDVANGGDVAAALPVLREAYWRVLDRRFVSPDAILRGTMQSAYADILPLAVLEGAARRLQASGPEHATELHHVAWVFWLGAAAERARRGDMIGARAATAHAEALAIPGKLPLTVPLRLLEGDVSAADALVEKAWAQGGFSAAQHLQLRLYRVLVRIAGARWSDALDEAQPFYAASTAMPLVSQDWAERATWLYVALRLHQGLPHLELNAPPRGSLGAAGFWSRTAERPEDERHKIRVEEGWVSRAFFSTDAVVRAYALYVVGRAADGAGDVDVWLDAMTPLGLPARVYFWERSMAAWMRGDEKAAGEWTARGKQMAALIHDDTTAVLASMAGY
jgi:hypothetical protein